MNATLTELRRNPKKILDAIERNEKVTLSRRGRDIAIITPVKDATERGSIVDDPAFGMWADRDDMADPTEYIRKLRRRRYSDL